jgi:myosin-5
MSLRQNLSGSTPDSNPDNLELELENVLTATDSLNDEVTLCLIKNLKIPSPTTTPPSTDKDVLFPAYLINLVTSKMWNKGFVKRSERFPSSVIHCIQHEVTQHEVADAIYSGAF